MEIIGIDPGLVHSGVVVMRLLGHVRTIEVQHTAIVGPNAREAELWLRKTLVNQQPQPTYIESYRPRGNTYNTDTKMGDAVRAFKQALPHAKVIDNTGVKKVVTQELMDLLGVWKFNTPTNHQDLRSAARIGIYGALKDHNERIYNVVNDHHNGRTWNVEHV